MGGGESAYSSFHTSIPRLIRTFLCNLARIAFSPEVWGPRTARALLSTPCTLWLWNSRRSDVWNVHSPRILAFPFPPGTTWPRRFRWFSSEVPFLLFFPLSWNVLGFPNTRPSEATSFRINDCYEACFTLTSALSTWQNEGCFLH